MIYKNEYTSNISFPLGGIGTGSIGLSGNGSLVDWEIFNRPNRESINSFSGFSIKVEDEKQVLDLRMLNGDIYKDFNGGMHIGNHSWGYGHGPNRGTLAGLKHFEDVEFSGEFPFAKIFYQDKKFPAKINLSAFNPFIPSNDKDSSLPTSIFDFEIENTSNKILTYTIALSVANPFKKSGVTQLVKNDKLTALILNSGHKNKNSKNFGNITISTNCSNAGYQQYWYRGGWFDNLTMFLNDFGTFGKIKNRIYTTPNKTSDISTITATITLSPNTKGKLYFNISWFVPNFFKYWIGTIPTKIPKWKNYYAKLFNSSYDVAKYCFDNKERLANDTTAFKNALFSSTLPSEVIDAIQGNIAILKSSTCLRLENGEFYGFEGVNKTYGSCEGTCMHVWNYAYALPFLFPRLERGIRDYELKYNLEKKGLLHFRTMLPLGNFHQLYVACVDGQMGEVMKMYREWKISGDTKWLQKHWGEIKKCIEFAWSKKNKHRWDIDKNGVIQGRQHNTLDIEIFGANSWLTGFYLGALLAGAKMAKALNDNEKAIEYYNLFKKGQKNIEKTFNNDLGYYTQEVDINNIDTLKNYGRKNSSIYKKYWDKENNQLKYQIAEGCIIDQVLADWHADIMGLENIFDIEHRKTALSNIYKNNFISMRENNNPCRIYACNDEKGVLICSYPKDSNKPKISIPYTEEFMTGFEYALADNLLQCGMEDKMLNIVKSIRDRYDGKKRNPWAEIECGASYSRAMASYSLLLTYSGFKYDLTKYMIGFKPIHNGKYFWSIDGAWGTVNIDDKLICLKLLYGKIHLKHFIHNLKNVSQVKVNDNNFDFTNTNDAIDLDIKLSKGDNLNIFA